VQASLDQVCVMLQALAGAAAVPVPQQYLSRRFAPGSIARAAPTLYTQIAADLARRFHDSSDSTRFLPHHYACIFENAAVLCPTDNAVTLGLSDVAADEIASAPGLWHTRDIVRSVVACANAELPAHRLFEAAAPELCERIDRDAALSGEEAAPRGLWMPALTLDETENVLWVYAVTRKAYPYSAKRVRNTIAAFLRRELTLNGESTDVSILADMLWSFAATWLPPKELFQQARSVLDARYPDIKSAVNPAVAESLQWSYGRARVAPPALCASIGAQG
jgi:hypothetical protein